jgi:hypothetical protein
MSCRTAIGLPLSTLFSPSTVGSPDGRSTTQHHNAPQLVSQLGQAANTHQPGGSLTNLAGRDIPQSPPPISAQHLLTCAPALHDVSTTLLSRKKRLPEELSYTLPASLVIFRPCISPRSPPHRFCPCPLPCGAVLSPCGLLHTVCVRHPRSCFPC